MASPPSNQPARAGGGQAARGAAVRVLRIGVVLGGKIVEERLVRERRDITIGQSRKNTIAVPLEGLPQSWPLLTNRNGRYELCFSAAMKGRLADRGKVATFDDLRNAQGTRPRERGGGWVRALSDQARGKIVLGELTLLFQFVDAPRRAAPVTLPVSVRGRLLDRVDPVLAIVMAVSLLLHFGVAIFAYQHDRVVKKRTARVFDETFQRPTVAVADIRFDRPQEPTVDEPEEAEQGKDEKPDEPAKSKQPRDQPRARPRDQGGSGGSDAEEALRLQEEAVAFANNLLSDDFSESGIGGGASDRDPGNDLADAIAAVRRRGATVEVGGGAERGTRGSGRTELGTGQGPGVEGPGETTTRTEKKVVEKVPRGRIKVGGSSSLDETTLRPNDVLRKIQTVYMNGLKRCHKDLLKRDPTAGGRVTLRFMVGETGRVVKVKAEGFDPGVDRCIETQANNWRFGVPRDEDGEPTDATFKISLVLQPE